MSAQVPQPPEEPQHAIIEFGVRQSLWPLWAEAAVDQFELTLEARRQSRERFAETGHPGVDEMKPAMLTLSCASHALEGFVNDFVTWFPEHPHPEFNPETANHRKLLETLRAFFEVGGLHAKWSPRLDWLFAQMRNPAIHNRPNVNAPVPHPVFAVNVAVEDAALTAESSWAALDIMMDILTWCAWAPKVGNINIATHCQRQQPVIMALAERTKALIEEAISDGIVEGETVVNADE